MTVNHFSAAEDRLTHPVYRPDIDGLRAVAVLSVIGFHAFPGFIRGGFTGVDVFFVISGYLISSIIFGNLENRTFSYAGFYSRRVKRIFPALLAVLSVSYVAGWFTLVADEYEQLGKHLAAGAGFGSNIVLWMESGYFDAAAETKPLLHLWSLGIEEQFYFVWPLLLGLLWRRRENFLVVTLIIAVASFAANIYFSSSAPSAAFYSPFTRFWELLAGGILAYLVLHMPHRFRGGSEFMSATGLVLILCGMLLIDSSARFPGWWALLPVSGACLVIAASPDNWVGRNILGNRMLVWTGLISYPLYLWHWPILAFARIIEGETPSAGIRISAVAGSLLLAWLTYRYVERPVRFGRPGGRKVLVLVLMLLLFCIAGFVTYVRDGFVSRKINKTTAFSYDWVSGYRHKECFIDAVDHSSGPAAFAKSCDGVSDASQKRPLVMLWGDSHAASLYRGLLAHSESLNFNLAQYNAAGCPPVMDFFVDKKKQCVEINRHVYSKGTELRPDTLILAANWALYNGKDKWNQLDYDKLKTTLRMLKEQGIPNIVLMGQLPTFHTYQPKVGAKEFRSNTVDRTYRNFNRLSAETDLKISAVAKESGVSYMSPIDLLCNSAGCLISASKERLVPLAWDYGHLTGDGSELLIDMAVRQKKLVLPGK